MENNLIQTLPSEYYEAWKPPQEISIPEWVEDHVRLTEKSCNQPGPLRISETPYTEGPLLAIGSHFIEWVALCWGRQLGKTEGVQIPFLCYIISQDPGPTLYFLPTQDKCEIIEGEKLGPMLLECEAVQKERTGNKDDYTILTKKFKRMTLSMGWAGSPIQLTSRSTKYLLRDEVDEFKKGVGPEGINPLKGIEATTAGFANRKILDTCTPTIPEGNIWMALKSAQYVFEFWIPCIHCGNEQILYWENVKFGIDKDPEVVATMAYYECEICHEKITNVDKIKKLNGTWRARLTKDPCEQMIKRIRAKIEETIILSEVLEDRKIRKVGFQLARWYSSLPLSSFGEAAKEFLIAKKSLEEGENFAPMRDWRKIWEALPYEETAISVQEHELEKNKIDLPEFVYPKDTIAITCGIDPGQKGFWFASIAWKWDMTPHLLHYGFLPGSYEGSDINSLLEWTYRSEDAIRLIPIWRIGIDTGGGEYSDKDATMTEEAYQWIRLHRKEHKGLLGTKGMSHSSPHRVRLSKIEKMPGEKGALIPGGIILLEINTDELKDAIWFHLKIDEGKAGRFTFHNNTGFDLMRHLTAEEKILDVKKNKFVWVRKRANHLLDCVVTAFALADPEFQGGIKVLQQGQGMSGGRRVISKGVE